MMQVINTEVMKKENFKQGGILICYIKDDYQQICENILHYLDTAGYIYYLLEMTPESCQELYFQYDAEEKIQKAECAIFIYSPIYQNKKYLACQQMFYYIMGRIESRQKEVYPFLLNMESKKMKDSLRGKPKFVETQWTNSTQTVINQIKKLKVSKELYFKDNPSLNTQVLPRIKQVKITAILHIYQDILKWAWDEGMDDIHSEFDESSERRMIDDLYRNLKVGAIVIRFGKAETIMQPAFSPYLPESRIILFDSPAHYDKTILPKPIEGSGFNLVSDATANERKISSTIRLEFLVPVHDILGTSFKPYILISKESYWKRNHLLALIKDTMVNESTIKSIDKENKLYFLLPIYTIDPGQEINDMVGMNCNFIYPK